jgi:hypothetical protein
VQLLCLALFPLPFRGKTFAALLTSKFHLAGLIYSIFSGWRRDLARRTKN